MVNEPVHSALAAFEETVAAAPKNESIGKIFRKKGCNMRNVSEKVSPMGSTRNWTFSEVCPPHHFRYQEASYLGVRKPQIGQRKDAIVVIRIINPGELGPESHVGQTLSPLQF